MENKCKAVRVSHTKYNCVLGLGQECGNLKEAKDRWCIYMEGLHNDICTNPAAQAEALAELENEE